MHYLKQFGFVVAITFFVFSFMGIIIGIGSFFGNIANRRDCRLLHEQTQKQTKFSEYDGCYVTIGGKWVPVANWRVPGNE